MDPLLFLDPNAPQLFFRIQRIRRMMDELDKCTNNLYKIDLVQHLNHLRNTREDVLQCVLYNVVLGLPLGDSYRVFDYDGVDSIEGAVEFHYYVCCSHEADAYERNISGGSSENASFNCA